MCQTVIRGTLSRYSDPVHTDQPHTDQPRPGRPRSEQARAAVLHAVDDLLVEVGYGAMTLKGIAERAGVGRQTVYRWWSTKAEILAEAVGYDAPQELAVTATGALSTDLRNFVEALRTFLTTSESGAAYRALLGEAQHDPAVAALLARDDVVSRSAREVITASAPDTSPELVETAALLLVGPVVFSALVDVPGRDTTRLDGTVVSDAVRLLRTDSPSLASDLDDEQVRH